MHELNVSLTSVNSVTDDNPANDTTSKTVDIIETYDTTQIHLELLTDDYAHETSWEFRSLDGTILYSGGPYQEGTDNNTIFGESFDVVQNECYFFEIFDEYGDGICCGFGNGHYTLTTDDGSVIINGGDFGPSEVTEIVITGTLGVSDNLAKNIIMFPNPANDFLNIQVIDDSGTYIYSIINILGQVIKKGSLNSGVNTISNINLNSGLYFVKVQDNVSNRSMVNKLLIK